MQKKVLIALFSSLIIILGIILFSMLSGDIKNESMSASIPQAHQVVIESQKRNKSWIEDLAQSTDAAFSFPVNELFLHVELKDYIPPKTKSFRLVIDRADRYSLFCIAQTLSSMDLAFVIEKQDMLPIVYINSEKKESLDKVVSKLSDYDIKSKIVEVWL